MHTEHYIRYAREGGPSAENGSDVEVMAVARMIRAT